jgi:hypothetical protein
VKGVTRAQGRSAPATGAPRRAAGTRGTRARVSARLDEAGDFAFDCLSHLAAILVQSGYTPETLLEHLRKACRSLRRPRHSWDPKRLKFLADVPHVISLWYSDPRYLRARGVPAALPLLGRGASLRRLIAQALPNEEPSAVLVALLRMKGIRRQGKRYVPTARHIAYREQVGRLHSLNVLMRILRTIDRNLSGRGSAILERNAIHPAFPVAELPGFHQRTKGRAEDFLWDLDSDMRRRERRARAGRRTRLGVEIFAFEEALQPARKPRTKTRAAGIQQSSRGRSPRRRRR